MEKEKKDVPVDEDQNRVFQQYEQRLKHLVALPSQDTPPTYAIAMQSTGKETPH